MKFWAIQKTASTALGSAQLCKGSKMRSGYYSREITKPDCSWIYTSELIVGFSGALLAAQPLIWQEACEKVSLQSLKKGKKYRAIGLNSHEIPFFTEMSGMVNCALIYEEYLWRGCYLMENKEHLFVFIFNKNEANYKLHQIKHGFPLG